LRIYRINNTINSKTGLYKIELRHDELMNLTIEEIKNLATNHRLNDVTVFDHEKSRNEKLYQLFKKYQLMYPDFSTEEFIKPRVTYEKIRIEGFDNIFRECSYIKSLVGKTELNNQERVVLGNLLSKF